MRIEPGKYDDGTLTMKTLRIIPDSEFERQWLQEFIGGGGPADDWQFLERTDRKAEVRVSGVASTVEHVDIGIHKLK